MVYNCQVLIVAPGGLGTLDELFEVLTLKQTGKVQKDLPVILFGIEYWQTIVNWRVRFLRYVLKKKINYIHILFLYHLFVCLLI